MDSITIVLDTDDAGLILDWMQGNCGYIPSEGEKLQLEAMENLKEQIQQELDNLSGEPDPHNPDHF